MNQDNYNPVLTGINERTGENEVGFEYQTIGNVSKSIEEITGKKIPHTSNICIIQVKKSDVADVNEVISYRQDGLDADPIQGFSIGQYEFIKLSTQNDIESFRCISVDGTEVPLAIQFYTTKGNS